MWVKNAFKDAGLSPRGRGNLSLHSAPVMLDGSIPAWAGEPPKNSAGKNIWKVYPRVGGGTAGRGRRCRH